MVFKRVKTFEEATAIAIFHRSNLTETGIILKDEANKELFHTLDEDVVLAYLKHINPHDRRNATIGFIKAAKPTKRFY